MATTSEIALYAGFFLILIVVCALHIRTMRALRRLRGRVRKIRNMMANENSPHRPLGVYVVARKKGDFPASSTVSMPSHAPSPIYGFQKDFAKQDANLLKQQSFVRFFKDCSCVLDIGCGKGEFLQLCRESNLKAVGIDFSEDKIRNCRLNNLEAHCADAFSYLSETDQSFDGVMCSHVIEHLSPEEVLGLTKIVSEEALDIGGIFVVLTPNPRSLRSHLDQFWKDMTHCRFYDVDSICYLLEKSGFEIVETGEHD